MARFGIRAITFQVYPESGNIKDTLTKLSENGLDGWCSPLHFPKNGKPHYHLVSIRFEDTSKGLSFATWQDIASVCGAANEHFDKCFPHDTAAYLIHDRDKTKQQWVNYQVVEFNSEYQVSCNLGNVISFGAVPDFKEYIKVHDDRTKKTKIAKQDVLVEVYQFIRMHGLTNYASLVNYCLDKRIEWFDVVASNSSMIVAYMKSIAFAQKQWSIPNPRDGISDKSERRVIQIVRNDDGFVSSGVSNDLLLSSNDIDNIHRMSLDGVI